MKYAEVLQMRKLAARIPRRNISYSQSVQPPPVNAEYPAESLRGASMELSPVEGRGPAGISGGAGMNHGVNPVNERGLKYRQTRKGSVPPSVNSFEGVSRSYKAISNVDHKLGKNKYFTQRQIVDPASGRVSYVEMRRSGRAKRRLARRPVQQRYVAATPGGFTGTGYARPMTRRSQGLVLRDRATAMGRARNQAPARRAQIARGQAATRRWQDQYRQQKRLYGDTFPSI